MIPRALSRFRVKVEEIIVSLAAPLLPPIRKRRIESLSGDRRLQGEKALTTTHILSPLLPKILDFSELVPVL